MAKPAEKSRNANLSYEDFVRYVDKVFHLFDVFRNVNDPRGANKTIPLPDTLTAAFMMLSLRFPGMNSFFNAELSMNQSVRNCCTHPKEGSGMPFSRSTVERHLAMVAADVFKEKLWQDAQTARRNKVFADNRVDGYTIGIIDGIQTFHSTKKKCTENCLTAHHRNGTESYSHKVAVLSIPCIGPTGHMVLSYEMLRAGDPVKKDEGEITGAKRLLKGPDEHLPGLIDIVTGDALYANAPCVNAMREAGAVAVIRVKGDNRTLIKDADERFNIGKGTKTSFKARNRTGDHYVVTATFDDDFVMPGVEEPVRMVRFTEIPILKDGTLDTRTKDGRRIREEKTFYMLSTDLSISVETIWKLRMCDGTLRMHASMCCQQNAILSTCSPTRQPSRSSLSCCWLTICLSSTCTGTGQEIL